MRPHATAPDHTGGLPGLLHDRVAILKNGGASSSAPALLHQQHAHGADILHLHPHGLSVRTGRRPQEPQQQQAGFNAQPDPRYRASTPYGLLGTPLNELLRGDDSFIMPDSALPAWHGGGGELGGFMAMPPVKQEPCSPAMGHLSSLPNTSTFMDFMSGGSGFVQAFGQPQQRGTASHQQHQQHQHQRQPQHQTPAMRPLQLPDPYAVQRFLQVAAELQKRAQALHEAETREIDRAKRLCILQPASRPSAAAPMHAAHAHQHAHPLLEASLDPLMHQGLGSPGSLAFMNCLQPQYLGSPTCLAEVRILDSHHNTPAKYGLLDL